MHRTNAAERAEGPGAPERRLAAAAKQLRIVREGVDDERRGLDEQIETAIDEVEAARELLQ